jgi:hypothetical protein
VSVVKGTLYVRQGGTACKLFRVCALLLLPLNMLLHAPCVGP